jgi:hypothetical protein
MATGTGKTTVMAMVAACSILNKVNDRSDARFSDAVLVVCPNVTIRSRLRELDPKDGDASLYRTRDIVPEHLMPDLIQGHVLVTNWPRMEKEPARRSAPANIEGFRNTPEHLNTIRVDSKVIHETDTGDAKNDRSAWMRVTLDMVGKT